MGVMNELIDASVVDRLRSILTASTLGPDTMPHLEQAAHAVDGLSLRERSDLVGEALLTDLPGAFHGPAALFRNCLDDPRFMGWMIWPVTTAAVTSALASGSDADFDDCLALLAELTHRLTGEFAIRRLLEHDRDRALPIITGWTTGEDEHVRRLASEGTRLHLPWAVKVRALVERPSATRPIIDALHTDASEYVRRSVSNHLNDISRTDPDLAVDIAAGWMRNADDATRGQTTRVVRHGLRTLIKKGHSAALVLMGFAPAEVLVSEIRLDADLVTLPGSLGVAFDVTNTGTAECTLAIDYAIWFVKANGTQSDKVFKLTSRTLQPGETTTVRKVHGMRQMTTRVHHPGTHHVEAQVNGARSSRTAFTVIT